MLIRPGGQSTCPLLLTHLPPHPPAPPAPVQAMAAALREREAALLTVQSIEDDLDKRRRAAAALHESCARRCGRQGMPQGRGRRRAV